MFKHHRMPDSQEHFERAIQRMKTAPNPVFIHIFRRKPDPALLARVRAKLPGPLLAYAVRPNGAGLAPDARFAQDRGYVIYRSNAKMKAVGFIDPGDGPPFLERLVRDLAAMVRL